jgi:hypothetical protein
MIAADWGRAHDSAHEEEPLGLLNPLTRGGGRKTSASKRGNWEDSNSDTTLPAVGNHQRLASSPRIESTREFHFAELSGECVLSGWFRLRAHCSLRRNRATPTSSLAFSR